MDGSTRLPLEALLTEAQACPESCSWAVPYGTDYERAWSECPNAAWLLYMARVCGVSGFAVARGAIRAVRVMEDDLNSHAVCDVRVWLANAYDTTKAGDRTALIQMGWKICGEFDVESQWSARVMHKLGHTMKTLSAPLYMKLTWRVGETLNVLFEELLIGEGPDTYRRLANAVREEIPFTEVLDAYRKSGIMNP